MLSVNVYFVNIIILTLTQLTFTTFSYIFANRVFKAYITKFFCLFVQLKNNLP